MAAPAGRRGVLVSRDADASACLARGRPPGAVSVAPPFFSVVVATWNRASLLPRALDSLAAQAWTDWEAIVVDDGSTDDTPELLARWSHPPTRRALARPHAGLSAARNAGIAAARGRWIAFLDSDDAYAPDHLAARAAALATDPDLDLLHGGYRVVGPPEAHFVPDADHPARMIPLSECVIGGTFVVRAAFLRALGGFPDIPYGMDYALMKKARAAGGRVGLCEAPTYIYHREPGVGMCEERRPD